MARRVEWCCNLAADLFPCLFRSRLPLSLSTDLLLLFVAPKTLLCNSHGRKDMTVRRKECSPFDVSQLLQASHTEARISRPNYLDCTAPFFFSFIVIYYYLSSNIYGIFYFVKFTEYFFNPKYRYSFKRSKILNTKFKKYLQKHLFYVKSLSYEI